MAKRDRTQEALDKLDFETADVGSDLAKKALTKALALKSNLVVARALKIIFEHELSDFEGPMRKAFERALVDPVKSDQGCRTKEGVVAALDVLREPMPELLIAGIRHVQLEPAWGKPVDTAARLRGMCAMALLNSRHPDTMTELARLLADPELEARRMAVDALAHCGNSPVALPLLTLRVLSGDPQPEFLSECFSALLQLDAQESFAFVEEYLRGEDPELSQAAAVALGQERPDGAFELLRECCEATLGEERRVLFLAMAMLRSDAAWGFLLESAEHDSSPVAREALEALAVYRDQADLLVKVREAVARRDDAEVELNDAIDELFES